MTMPVVTSGTENQSSGFVRLPFRTLRRLELLKAVQNLSSSELR